MMMPAGRRREDARRPPFRVAGPRRPPVRSRPRRDGRGRWDGRGEWDGDPVHNDDHGPVRARVCCAPFPLLRPLTLHCTRRRGAAEGKGAQQTEKGAADGKKRSRRGRPPRIRGSSAPGTMRVTTATAPPRGSGGPPGEKGSFSQEKATPCDTCELLPKHLSRYMNKPPGVFLPGSSRRRPDPMGSPRGEMGGARRPEPETDRTEFSPWRDG